MSNNVQRTCCQQERGSTQVFCPADIHRYVSTLLPELLGLCLAWSSTRCLGWWMWWLIHRLAKWKPSSVLSLNADQSFLLHVIGTEMQEATNEVQPWQRKILLHAIAWWANVFFFCGCFSLSVSRWGWVRLQTALPSQPLTLWLCQSCPEKVELQLRYSGARLNCSFCLHCLSFPSPVNFPAFLWCTLEQVRLLKWFS